MVTVVVCEQLRTQCTFGIVDSHSIFLPGMVKIGVTTAAVAAGLQPASCEYA